MADQATDELDDLDGERPDEPYAVRAGGRAVVFRPAAGPGWRELMEALAWPPAFMATFGPDDPDDVAAVESLSVGQMRVLLRGWRVHHGLCPTYDDNVRLASMMAKPAYRIAAERDLWEIQKLDLTTEWRSRRWRRLLNLLDGLRRASHVQEAMSQDDELAEMWLERERRGDVPDSKPRRRVAEFGVTEELLSIIADRQAEMALILAAQKGSKRRRVDPMPRPETAITRAREKRARRQHKYTVARVYGLIDAQGKPTGAGPVPEGTPPTP